MADLRESALLFSLKHLDQQRLREEELVTWRRTEIKMAARIRAEHRARLEQQALMVAEEARLRAEAAARREEAARHEAIRIAAMDRARVEAEQAAKIALLAQQQEHERRMAALVAEHHRRTLSRALVGAIGLTVGIVSTLTVVYLAHMRPEAARARRHEAAAISARESTVAQLKADVERANRRAEDARQDARRVLAQTQGAAARVEAAEPAVVPVK
jgi:colicin import membrane protein